MPGEVDTDDLRIAANYLQFDSRSADSASIVTAADDLIDALRQSESALKAERDALKRCAQADGETNICGMCLTCMGAGATSLVARVASANAARDALRAELASSKDAQEQLHQQLISHGFELVHALTDNKRLKAESQRAHVAGGDFAKRVVAGFLAWAADEDGVHYQAWDVYQEARKLAGMEPAKTGDEEDELEASGGGECKRCHGSGTIECTRGGDGFAVQDYEATCPECGEDEK